MEIKGDEIVLGLKENKQISKWFVLSCLLFFLFSTFTYGIMHQSIAAKQRTATVVYVKVKPGMNAEKIADLLYAHKITDSIIGFKIMAKMNGLDNKLKAGDYAFNSKMSYREIIAILVEGRTSAFNITIPEGYDVDRIANLLEDKGVASAAEFKRLAKDFAPYDYVTADEASKYRIEGFLFPNTYEVIAGQSAQDILVMLSKEFDHQFTPQMRSRAEVLGLTMRQVIILASLVEKEAQVDIDRPIIAQVFMNRIREWMPLQSCATIQYILGSPKPELSVQDTKIESPYNTYQHMGLPPGPIANPGVASINAVLFSEPTDYLYFVADKNGKHHFSKTYDEHLAAIDRVQ